tara:strand:- start:3952 stop:4485 length:534 start_codon:yes stop_codon:yes gene_type:complete
MQLSGTFDTHNALLKEEIDNKINSLTNKDTIAIFHNISNLHYNYIDSIIDSLISISKVDDIIDSKNYKQLSSPKYVNELFFNSSGYTKFGKAYIERTNVYKDTLLDLVNHPLLRKKIYQLIPSSVTNYNSDEIFLEYYFQHISLIGVITHLKNIQNNILLIELSYLNNKTNANTVYN